ncbi:MAG TPA: antibiotic biosynthesis monooxygenase family protein [Candidatus Angelobacter sp.]
MFTRIVEITAKPGKAAELFLTLHNKVLPILRKQSGFTDVIVLQSDADPEVLLEMSFWKSKADAERFNRMEFTRIAESIQSLIQAIPQVRTFNVEQSTIQRVSAAKAA